MLLKLLYFTQGVRLIEHAMEYHRRESNIRAFVNVLCGLMFILVGIFSEG